MYRGIGPTSRKVRERNGAPLLLLYVYFNFYLAFVRFSIDIGRVRSSGRFRSMMCFFRLT